MSVHQKFNAMVGIQRETAREEETQVLDSLNDDPLLRLHYGLHVTFQVNMALDLVGRFKIAVKSVG